jgi:DNA invertase Pin-like site-specific DNA recombinase
MMASTTSACPVLAKTLAALRSGDTLVVWRLDRLGRSLGHLIEVATVLRERGVFL